MENVLYYGDNLDILKRYIPDESIDLIYLDPTFKSSQNYNILFKEQNGSRAASQIRAFEDTWTWSQEDDQKRTTPSVTQHSRRIIFRYFHRKGDNHGK